MSAEHTDEAKSVRILLYSDDRTIREQVRTALGRRLPGVGAVSVIEVATPHAAVETVEQGGIDLAILDGESVPMGGMGVARQVKDEVANCPPCLVLVGRIQDAWLATWSRAEAVVPHPVDPIQLPQTVADLLRGRAVAHA